MYNNKQPIISSHSMSSDKIPAEHILAGEALEAYNKLLLREESFKIQLDSPQGQSAFRNYMLELQKLSKVLGASFIDRNFRSTYTNAYRVLYSEGNPGYIPEIFDSAQQAFACIYVNGERFDFSADVLQAGEALIESHCKLVHLLRFISLRGGSNQDQTPEFKQLKERLQVFDKAWTHYEARYIGELIGIQQMSKERILQVIAAEKLLTEFENKQRLRGKIFLCGTEYDELRKKLCELIARLNSVANADGKGRDDLTFEILVAAENVLGTVTHSQSRSVRLVAEKIRQSFQNVREVLRFFGQNLEMVDPQLKNNPELVAALLDYESFWEKGKRYFLQPQKQSQIVAFSAIVEAAKDKYPAFTQLLEYSDPRIFWIIPSLIVLRSLQGQDQGLAQSFLQTLALKQKYQQYIKLRIGYNQWKRNSSKENCFKHYNILQQMLIGDSENDSKINLCEEEVSRLLNKIKQLAVSLERVSPIDWNDMLGVLLIQSD